MHDGEILRRVVDRTTDDSWHAALAQFDDGHYEQTAYYSKGNRGEQDSNLLLLRDEGIVAGARVAVYSLPVVKKGVALVRFGPFWRRRDGDADLATYRAVIGALAEEYCVRRGLYLTVRPRPSPAFFERECQVLQEFGFLKRREMPAPHRFLIDVTLDEEAQLKSLGQKWRHNLRQSNASALDIRWANTEEGMAAFDSIYAGMVDRKNLNYSGLDLVGMIPALSRLPSPIAMQTALAFHAGRPVAGATVGVLGDTAYYVFGASDSNGLALRAGYALQWWLVRWLSAQRGPRWYDLGGTGDPGIRQFKSGFVGKRGSVVAMKEFDYWTRPSARLAADAIFSLRDARNTVQRWRRKASGS